MEKNGQAVEKFGVTVTTMLQHDGPTISTISWDKLGIILGYTPSITSITMTHFISNFFLLIGQTAHPGIAL